jgi:hypothetical protein
MQRVLPFLVLKIVKDPLVLHQPRDELKSSFPILHAILALGKAATELYLEVSEP